MQITFNPNELSATDRTLLAQLIGVNVDEVDEVDVVEETPAPAAAPARRRRAAAKPAPEPEPEEAEEDEPEDEEEDLLGEDDEGEASAKITLDDCVALATSLVQKGKSADVKAALTEVGAAKVSQVKGQAKIDKLHGLLKKIK